MVVRTFDVVDGETLSEEALPDLFQDWKLGRFDPRRVLDVERVGPNEDEWGLWDWLITVTD